MSSVMPYESVQPYGSTLPAPDAAVTPASSSMSDPAALGNSYLDQGMSQEEAISKVNASGDGTQKFAVSVDPKTGKFKNLSTPGVIPYDDVKPFTAPTKAYPNLKVTDNTGPDSTLSMIGQSIMGTPIVQGITNNARNSLTSMGNIPAEAVASIRNYGKNHETIVPDPYNTRDQAAAKLLGVSGISTLGQAPIYKMSPDQQQALQDQTLEGMGLNPKKERDQISKTMEGDLKDGNIVGAFLHNDSLLGALGNLTSPEAANTKRYHRIKAVSHLMDISQHPGIYPDEMVTQANAQLDALQKKKDSGTLGDLKEMGSSFAQDPVKSAAALGVGFATSPELAWAPEMRVGKALYASKLATAAKDAEVAGKAADLASKIKFAPGTLPGEAEVAATKAAELADKAKKSAGDLSKIQSRASLVNRAGAAASGGAINAGISAEQQIDQQGFVAKGSLGAPAVVGSIFGGVLGGGKEKVEKGKPVPYEAVKPVPPGTGEAPGTMDYMKGVAGDPLPRMYPDGTGPGAPIPSDTPINTKNHVGYVGGTDATTPHANPGESLHDQPRGIVHYSKEMPQTAELPTKDGGTVTVPVAHTTAFHEAVESALLHLKGPVSPEQLALIHQRMGPYDHMEPGVEDKLKAGTSLTYAEGHDIATRSENHHVEEQFNVDPKVYQDWFKPHIKKVAEANKTAAPNEIPENLDTKPYDNMGHPEVNKGQGSRPDQDQGEKGTTQQATVDEAGKVISEKGDSTGPQKNIIHKLAKEKGMDDPTYRSMLKKVAGVDSAKALSKKAASAVIKHLKDNKVGLAITAGAAGLGAFENKDKKGGMLGGAVGATFFALAARHPEIRDKANEMKKAGVSAADIQKQLGVFQGADKVWRGEFSDKEMAINLDALRPGDTVPFKDVVYHNKYEKMFPNLSKKLKIQVDENTKRPGGFYDPRTHTIHLNDKSLKGRQLDPSMNPKEVILHEMMHTVQHREGLPNGSNFDHLKTELDLKKENLEQQFKITAAYKKAAIAKGDPAKVAQYTSELLDIHHNLLDNFTPKAIQEAAWEKYFHTSGEHEARAVVDRMHWSEETLKGVPVEKTMGMPMHLQRVGDVFVRKPGEVAASSNVDTTLKDRFPEYKETDKVTGFRDALQSANDRVTSTLKSLQDAEKADNWDNPFLKKAFEKSLEDQKAAGKNLRKAMQEDERSQGIFRDSLGREVPTPKGWKPPGQRGNATQDHMKKLAHAAAFGTVGATLGLMYGDKDHPFKSALTWGLGATFAGPLMRDFVSHPIESSKNFGKMIKDTTLVMKGETVGDSLGKWQASAAKTDVVLARINHAVKELGISKQERLDVGKAMEGDKTVKLSPAAQKAFNLLRNFDDELGRIGIAHGVLKDLIADHLSHIWKKDAAFDKYVNDISQQVTAGMSPTSAFAKLRSIKSLAEGKAHGLTPLTEDPVEILNHYARSVLGAVRNKSLLSDLRRAKDTEGKSYLVVPTKAAPHNFVTINHPQLRGLMVHPAIASEMRQVFYSYDLGKVQAALDTLNMGMKRVDVSGSIFHLTSLLDGFLGSSKTFTHPVRTAGEAGKAVLGKSDYAKALLNKSDPAKQAMFERGLDAGVKFQIDRDNMVDRDVGGNYYAGLKQLSDFMDRGIPYSGKIPESIAGISHLFDKVIFENGMNGMKFSLFMNKVDELNNGWADLKRRKPDTVIPSQKEIDKVAAGHVNTTLGAQDWIGAANQATTKFGRLWLRALGSPLGRRTSQYLMFSPDWTTSTFMSLTKALGKGSEQFGTTKLGMMGEAFRGLKNPKTQADVARMYQIRSAALYALIGGTINYAYTGRYIWDNKDPTTIDFGNGQRMQWNKHWMEPYQAARDTLKGEPLKFAAGKMGPLLKEGIDQAAGIEYWNPAGESPKMRESRLAHFGNAFKPIPFQNLKGQNANSLFWNAAGRNVVGHRNLSPQERLQDLMERKEQIKKDRERRLQAQQKRGQ